MPTTIFDPAACFAASLSLHRMATKVADENRNNLSAAYDGGDGFLRECARIGNEFEKWACDHIDFDALDTCWPYHLEASFGQAAIDVAGSECHLFSLTEEHWPLIASKLGLVSL